MAENNNKRITGMLLSKGRRAQYIKVFAVLAACIAVAVGFALRYNGVAMTHEERTLACPVAERIAEAKANGETPPSVAHVHDESCYDADGNLVCPLEEKVLHTHDESCYDADGNLVCPLEEKVLHTHDDSCYTTERRLVCGLEEGADHVHTDACYQTERKLTCGKEEIVEEHVHGPGCFETVTVSDDADEDADTSANDAEADEGDDAAAKVDDNNAEGDKADDKAKDAEADKAGDKAAATDKDADKANAAKDDKADDKAAAADKADDKTKDAEADKADDKAAATDKADDKAKDADKANTSKDTDKDADKAAATDKADDKTKDGDKTKDNENLPAQSFEQPVTNAKGEEVLRVKVEAPAGAFPKGTTMEVKSVKSSEVSEVVSEAMADAGDKRDVDSMEAVDIVFRDENGKEIEPLLPITVSMTSDKIADKATNPVLVHVDDKGKGEVVDQLSDKQAAERKVETGDDTLAFDADAFSVYVIAYTVDFHWEVNGKKYEFSIPGGGFVSLEHLIEVLDINSSDKNTEKSSDPAENSGDAKTGTEENAKEEGAHDGGTASYEEAISLNDAEVSEATKQFVADVAKVEFSSPDLVWVGKVDADSTVGGLKEANKLKVEYSAGLTKEQIAEINAQTVEAGDWALISMLPFISEESLTVTMENGDQFTIRVTDAQISKRILTADGKTYEINVTYGEDAQIPVGSELKVEEITKEDDRYTDYYEKTLEMVDPVQDEEDSSEKGSEDKSVTDQLKDAVDGLIKTVTGTNTENDDSTNKNYARIFDIQIWNGEERIEPQADVRVDIRLLDAPEDDELSPKVVHFAEAGPEVMEISGSAEEKDDEPITFITDEFSVYSIFYTVDFEFEVNGKVYAFSMNGEDSISLRALLETLHVYELVESDDETSSDGNKKAVEAEASSSDLTEENALGQNPALEKLMAYIDTVTFSDPKLVAVAAVDKDMTLGDIKAQNNIEQSFASWENQGEVEDRNSRKFTKGDWALISLKPFSTNETLEIVLKTGEIFTIKVTDAQDANMQEDGVHVDTITNPAGTTIDLFNYWISDDLKDKFARTAWPGYYDGWYYHDEDDYAWYKNGTLLGTGNDAGINAGHMFKFSPAWAGTVYDGTIPNKVNSNLYSPTRNPTNVSYTNDGDRLYYTGGVNSYTGNGDPNQGLVEGTLDNGYPKLTNDSSKGTNGESLKYLFTPSNGLYRDYYGGVDKLLYVDSDGYYTYDSRDYKAELQSDGKTFSLTEQTSGDTEVRGFWPFGQQVFWVGMHMNTQFSMPTNGQVLNPKGAMKDMQFEFSGDDDTWLYIDGVLVGDGGGVHNRTEIDVNFAKGTATVTGKKDKNHTGDFEETKYLDDIFKAAGKYIDADWEDIGDGSGNKRFKAGTYHTFDMFYLERGGGESNLYIHYNLVSTADFTGHKAYEGLGEDDRLARDQFQFEMIGLDGQYQSVWDSNTQTATVSLVDADGQALMPIDGTESGDGTVASPKKVYSSQAWANSEGGYKGGYIYTTGVTEDGNINFGTVNINETEMNNCDSGHPSVYRYIIREVVPNDAANQNGIRWDAATEEQKTAGGFVKDQITYDGTIYYMTARVTSWTETKPDGTPYIRYGLSKTYYTDDTFSTVDNKVTFVDFRNRYTPDRGKVEFIKVDGSNNPLSGATFTLYANEDCTHVAKDLDGKEQVITTGADGKVVFDNMPAPKTYYMKETEVPDGYQLNSTVYKVIIEDSKDTTKTSKIIVNGDETETPLTKIINTKPGELSVIKKWVDTNGKEVAGGSNTARVQLRRYHYAASGGGSSTETHSVTVTFKFDHSGGWGVPEKTFTDSVQGSTANISWNVSGAQFYWDQTYTDELTSPDNGSYSVDVALSSGANSFTIYCPNEWAGSNLNSCTIGAVQEQVTYNLVEDTDFPAPTNTAATQTLSSANDWSYTWKIGDGPGFDLPITDGANPYLYYVVEVKEDGNGGWTEVPVGGELQDGVTLQSIVYPPEKGDNVGIQAGAVVVTNEASALKTINVRIKKTDDAKNSTNYLSGAVFKLTYRSDSAEAFSNVSNESVVELDSDSQFTVPSSGVTLTGLIDGQYQLQEISPPVGYVITNSYPVTFTVSGGTITSTEGTITDVRYTPATSSTNAEFIVPNVPGEALPATGGSGTVFFTITGGMMTLLAGGLLLMRRHKSLV